MGARLRRVLVLYSTVSGCTASIARRIGADLIAFGVRPQVCAVGECPEIEVGSFDAVVLGSGVRLGRWHKDMREWIMANRAKLAGRPLALFSVGLHGVMPDGSLDRDAVSADLKRVLASVGVKATAGETFLPGWKQTEGFSSMEKVALRVYPLAEGDYRDWDLVDSWVHSIAPLLLDDRRRPAADAGAARAKAETGEAAAAKRPARPGRMRRSASPDMLGGGLVWEECRA